MKEEGIDYNSVFCQIMRHYSALYDKKQQQQLRLFVRLVAAVSVIVVLITFSLLKS